jgi:Heterokaryon incompatibility protein (HET)
MDHFCRVLLSNFQSNPNQDPELNAHLLQRILSGYFVQSPPLTYEPLPTPSSIRILELLPGASHDPIKCALDVTDLATDSKVYTALSYVWGNSDDRLVIDCNGQRAPVTPNLYSALLRLRNPGQPRHLWVDALCINQALGAVALRERELQVRMMDKIYTHAREVIVDLGGANLAFEELLSTFCKFNTEPLDSFKRAAQEQRIVEGFEEFDFSSPFWPVWEEFLHRPWFKRVWVVQEFILARNVIVMAGTAKFSSEFLIHAMEGVRWHVKAMLEARLDLQDTLGSFQIAKSLWAFEKLCEMRYAYQRGAVLSFTRLFDFAVTLNATDNRDRIYALLGLAEELGPVTLPVSYSECDAALSIRVARFLVSQGRGVYVLCRASGLDPERPSWAPSLNLYPEGQGLERLVNGLGFCEIYQACGPTTSWIRLEPIDPLLVVRGGIIGAVSQITNGCSLSSVFPELRNAKGWWSSHQAHKAAASCKAWYSNLSAWATENFKDLAYEDFREQFWRTIILDWTGSRSPHDFGVRASPDFQRHFEAFDKYFNAGSAAIEDVALPPDELKLKWYEAIPFCNALVWAFTGRKICRTDGGGMAMVPEKAGLADQICIFLGVPIPFVIRRAGDHHILIGPCYVHGMMDGQALESESWTTRDIALR